MEREQLLRGWRKILGKNPVSQFAVASEECFPTQEYYALFWVYAQNNGHAMTAVRAFARLYSRLRNQVKTHFHQFL